MKINYIDSYIPNGEKYAVCLGSFDGIHKGHKRLMEKTVAKAQENGIKSAVLTFIYKPEKNKVFPVSENLKRIEATGIDEVFIIEFTEEFRRLSPEKFVKRYLCDKLSASFVICGFNFRFGFNREGDTDTLRRLGEGNFELTVEERVTVNDKTVSSSRIKELLKEGNIAEVNSLLGDCYYITGEVKKGKQLGRSIEFPTVNLPLLPFLTEIKKGVYSSVTEFEGNRYNSISYVGNAPTVGACGEMLLETYLLNFTGDLYGKEITVKLVGFIREEKKFSDLEELKKEIEQNIKTSNKQISECEYI